MDFYQKWIVLSGGSRGLGLELARCFAEEGAKLCLLARDREELERARSTLEGEGATALIIPCDIRDQEAVRRAVRSIVEQTARIDVLVNNAGIIQAGPAEHMSLEDFQDALAVHLWGPLYLMEEVIPHMRRLGGGRIVNISSIGGKVALPHFLPYCASKFALVGLSDGLRAELAKDDIRVTTVCPGLMRTGSHVNALFKGKHDLEFTLFSIANALPFLSTDARRAALRIVDACRYADASLVITPQARLLDILNVLSPNLVADALAFAGRLLPGPRDEEGNKLKSGWECRSRLAPSFLTTLADKAIAPNNEIPYHTPHGSQRTEPARK